MRAHHIICLNGRRSMPSRRSAVITLSLLLGGSVSVLHCGGKLAGTNAESGPGEPDGGEHVIDSGEGSSTGSGSATGVGSGTSSTASGSGSSMGSGSSGAMTCTLPPYATPREQPGECTFCDNKWYCPFPRFPVVDCPPGVHHIYDPCTVACVQCSDGSASYFPCQQGEYTLLEVNEFSCSM